MNVIWDGYRLELKAKILKALEEKNRRIFLWLGIEKDFLGNTKNTNHEVLTLLKFKTHPKTLLRKGKRKVPTGRLYL